MIVAATVAVIAMPPNDLTRTVHRRWTVAVVGVALVAAVSVIGAEPASAAYGPTITFVGHGFGHGRGLGQYGSYGYAVDRGFTFEQILAVYYPNTAAGSIDPATTMSTRLGELVGLDTVVVHDGAHLTTSAAAGEFSAVRVQRASNEQLNVFVGTGCDGGPGGWQPLGSALPVGSVRPTVSFDATGRSDGDPVANLLAICEPDGQKRYYRGTLYATLDAAGVQHSVNVTGIDSYLRGVVPRESPASWGDAGGGRGMAALRAQSVAARSYALTENRYAYAKTCDSQACQVYGGAGVVNPGSPVLVTLEDRRTDQAIADTTLAVRIIAGAPARTEFSSSTGGWTGGGATFPVVADLGDATSVNPNVNWSTTLNRADIEAKYPTIGTLLLIDVTKRNGAGDWGGRVSSVVLRGTTAAVTLTGEQARLGLGLKSDWFYVRPPFTDNPVVGVANTAVGTGYWFATNDGGVYNFGAAPYSGSMTGVTLNSPVIGLTNAGSNGYWLLGRDGGIFSFGSAAFYGSTGDIKLTKPVVAIAARPSGDGYWFVASDGGVFAYGAAPFFGSMGGRSLSKPIVGMSATASGSGYWLVAADGGIFAFGDAQFYGSTGTVPLTRPIVAMAARPQGDGYWLVASDGGVFAFGAAGFAGSAAGLVTSPVVSISATPTGKGYRIVTADGAALSYGDASG
jgi:SpoIID/LytB domain protein